MDLFIIVTDEEVSTIIDEALQRPFIKRGSMRLRRLRRADRLQSLKRSDRLQRLRREDGDTPEGAPEGNCNFLCNLIFDFLARIINNMNYILSVLSIYSFLPSSFSLVDMSMHPAITWRHGQGMME